MNKFTTFLLFLAFIWTTQGIAQSKKIPFIEHFSNTKCPICQSNRPGIEKDLEKYKGEVNTMTIHRKYPYSSCPLYLYSKTDADNRELVYTNSTTPLSGTPTLCVNSQPGHYSSLVRRIDQALEETSVPIGLNMVEKGSSSKEVSLEVINLSDAKMDNLFVYAALIEKKVNINVDNQNWEISHVFRKFLGKKEGKGDSVGILKVGEKKEVKLTGEVPSGLEPSDLYILAWVEQRVPDGDKYKIIMHNSVSVNTTTITTTALKIPLSELSIFPNPASDVLNLRNTSEFVPDQFRILSGQGKEIKIMNATGSINIADLTPGNYFLILENNNSRVSRKFIKQ